jgi:hypothetical protein
VDRRAVGDVGGGRPYCVPVMPAVVAPLRLTSVNDVGRIAAATSDG